MAKKFKGNHISGKAVSGGHTTVIDGVSAVVAKFAALPWFVSVRAGIITTGKKVGGGAPFVAVRRHKNEIQANTLELTFKRSGVVQKIYVQVEKLDENMVVIIADMEKIVYKLWKGAEFINRI